MAKKKLSKSELAMKKLSALVGILFATKDELRESRPIVDVVSVDGDKSAADYCTITTAADAGREQMVIFRNDTGTTRTVTLPSTGVYRLPNSNAGTVECPAGGYCEVNFLNVTDGNTVIVYVRAL